MSIEESINELAESEYGADAREPLIQSLSEINNSLEAPAEIEEYLNDIQNAVYGQEVLDAICNAIRAISAAGGGADGGEAFWNLLYPDSSIPAYSGDWTDDNGEGDEE